MPSATAASLFLPIYLKNRFPFALTEIAFVGDAYRYGFNTYFDIETLSGGRYIFSLNYLNRDRTQAIVDLIRARLPQNPAAQR